MSEQASEAPSAGALLRAAREKQGLHIAVLAASIKVPKAKLEALENDRYDELPDVTFTRALAQTVCRALKIDANPVLARLPHGGTHRLEPIGGGLNEPFRERTVRSEPSEWALLSKPMLWVVLFVLLAAVVLFLVPDELLDRIRGAVAPAASTTAPPAASPAPTAPEAVPAAPAVAASVVEAAPPAVVVETIHSAPPAAAVAEAAAAGIAVLRTTDQSWIEVQDGRGQVLLSRMLMAGEVVGLDGALPLRVKIGNVAATELSFRGQPVNLASTARDNVARLELK
jgi:cytoskeleton protein RodZ